MVSSFLLVPARVPGLVSLLFLFPNSHAVGFQSLGLDLVQHFTAAKIRNTWRWNRWNLCPGTFAFLEPKEFLEPVEPVKRMGFHRFQAFLGFKHAMVPQVPHRFHTGSTQVPHRFLGFNQATGSTGSRQVPWVQPRYGSTASRQFSWVQKTRGSTGSMHSLGSTTHWFHRVPDRFLGFKHAMVPQVPDRFLGFKKRAVPQVPCIPWVQQPTGSTGFQTGSLGSNTQWFHRFHTGSLGSTRPLVPQVPDRFLGFNHAMVPQVPHRFFGFNTPLVPHSLGSTTPWVQQVPCRFLGFNHATGSTGIQTGSLG